MLLYENVYFDTFNDIYSKYCSDCFSSSAATVYGDMNDDGKLSSYDVIYVARAIVAREGCALSDEQEALADVDLSGTVGALDCIILARHLADWEGYEELPSGGIATLLHNEDFNGTSFDGKAWAKCPEWERQGNSVWDDDMSYLDGDGHLVLRAEWDSSINKVRCGAVRTMTKNYRVMYSGGLGYYEASIKFPLDARQDKAVYKNKGPVGIWTAFWMMCGDVSNVDGSSADGVEIDIIETISSDTGKFSSNMHWDGYTGDTKSRGSGDKYSPKIYDGEFHRIGLERTEDATIFYVDGIETWRITTGDKANNTAYTYTNCTEEGYMKLTIESATWAYENNGKTQADVIASLGDGVEMVVDYVRVYSQNPYR